MSGVNFYTDVGSGTDKFVVELSGESGTISARFDVDMLTPIEWATARDLTDDINISDIFVYNGGTLRINTAAINVVIYVDPVVRVRFAAAADSAREILEK